MTRQVIAALLATVAWLPAHAQDAGEQGWRGGHHERAPRADDTGARPDRPVRVERPAPAPAAPPAPQQRPAFAGDQGRRDWGRHDDRPAPAVAEAPQPGRQWGRRGDAWTPERQAEQPRPDWQRAGDRPGWQGKGDGRGLGGRVDDRRADGRRQDARPVVDRSGADAVRRWQDRHDDRSDDRRDGRWGDNRFQAGTVYRGDDRGYGGGRDWSRDWRHDRQYDWSGYRQSNRGLYRLPRYYAPSEWNYGYRRFSIGVTLFSGLWDQNYWIDDPYEYRLPPAYGPYRWVRYYNDALLVDIRTGYVVDTVYDIFY